MLSKPKHGWTDITIENYTDVASYLTDVPNEVLEAVIKCIKKCDTTCVKFDTEGTEFIIIFDVFDIHIINTYKNEKIYSYEKNIKDIGKEIYKDITDNLEDWKKWDQNEPTFLSRLYNNINELKDLLYKEEDLYNKNREEVTLMEMISGLNSHIDKTFPAFYKLKNKNKDVLCLMKYYYQDEGFTAPKFVYTIKENDGNIQEYNEDEFFKKINKLIILNDYNLAYKYE